MHTVESKIFLLVSKAIISKAVQYSDTVIVSDQEDTYSVPMSSFAYSYIAYVSGFKDSKRGGGGGGPK